MPSWTAWASRSWKTGVVSSDCSLLGSSDRFLQIDKKRISNKIATKRMNSDSGIDYRSAVEGGTGAAPSPWTGAGLWPTLLYSGASIWPAQHVASCKKKPVKSCHLMVALLLFSCAVMAPSERENARPQDEEKLIPCPWVSLASVPHAQTFVQINKF